MKTHYIFYFLLLVMTTTCMTSPSSDNPFFTKYDTPYGTPPFDKIKIQHYKPAFEKGMAEHNAEIEKIIQSNELPNFENTILALDRSGELLTRVDLVFGNLNSAETNDSLQALDTEMAPILSKHYDNIWLNMPLFAKVKAVKEGEKANLTPEQLRLLDETYKRFVRNGAELTPEQQTKIKQLNEQLAVMTVKFGQNIMKETNGYTMPIIDSADLSGLPVNFSNSFKKDGKWVFSLQNPSVMPFLQYADKRDLRSTMFTAYTNRCNNNNEFDNKKLAADIANLRLEKAKIMGYPNHASYVLDNCMAKNPANVYKMLGQLWAPALKIAEVERQDMQTMINKGTDKFQIKGEDWRYYSEKVKKEKYDLEEETLRPYFQLENVREGIFTLCNKLFGIRFEEVKDIPLYHSEVVTYKVIDHDNSLLGILYMDFFPRPGKRVGAWMTSYREEYYENNQRVIPLVSLVCNFTRPVGDMPSLLTADEVETFFHEFGHGLHGLLTNCQYVTLSGTSVARDFVELPSQIMENWAFEPEVLALYAKHYKTGELIPTDLVNKIQSSAKFGQGFKTVEYLAASILDLDYHTIDKNVDNVLTFEEQSMNKIKLLSQIPPRYRTTYFNHIFSGGYSAGYYSYIWAEVLDADAFAAFKESGDIFNKQIATAYRKNILEKGNTQDPMELYQQFRGKEPSIEPLLVKRGLK